MCFLRPFGSGQAERSPLDPWCLSMVLDIGCRQIPARDLSLWQVVFKIRDLMFKMRYFIPFGDGGEFHNLQKCFKICN